MPGRPVGGLPPQIGPVALLTMADTQDPEEPTYGWLYGAAGPPPESSDDPESTQQLVRPAADDLAENRPAAGAAPGGGPEHTQILDVHGLEPATPHEEPDVSARANQSGPSQQPVADTPAPPRSFGGTYDAPPRRSAGQPRFASPADPMSSSQPPAKSPATSPAKPPAGPPSAAPAGKGPRRGWGNRKWWVRGILALVLVWILFLVLVPIWAWSRIAKVAAEPGGNRPADSGGTTFLLVGSDSRQGLTKQQKGDLGTGSAAGQRTDTILMLHVPDSGGPNLLLSIPRDSYVDIPGHGKNKINAAYAFGGPKLLVQTVERSTGVRIDDYVEIGFTGFVDIVDAVGGIQVCPKTAVNDRKAGHLKMRRGCQDVDGHTALGYSRSRAFPLGDITRTEHQREVITQVGKKAASWSTILLPWRYFAVNKAASESVRIGDNVGPLGLAKFAWAMGHSGDAKRCVVPFSNLGASTPAGSAVLWDEAKAKSLFTKIREDNTSAITCNNGG